MIILEEVQKAYQALTTPEKEARNIALACALEPISDKAGCVTRRRDLPHKTLEMFVGGGVNIYPAFHHLAEYLQRTKAPSGAYRFFHEAILLSKANRKGAQINQGILEFSLPIVAAHVLYDPLSNDEPTLLFDKAVNILKGTNTDDVKSFMQGKFAGRDITSISRGVHYDVRTHDVSNVYEYYQKEYELELQSGRPTSGVHNRQFVESFPDIRLAWETFIAESNRKFSERLVDAYNKVMAKEENKGIGPGLAADFIAVTIYLALSYANGLEIIE